MRNPFKSIKAKAVKFKNSPLTKAIARVTVTTGSAAAAGVVVSIGVSKLLAKTPMMIGARTVIHIISYSVASTITHEVVDEMYEPTTGPVDYHTIVQPPVEAQNEEE